MLLRRLDDVGDEIADRLVASHRRVREASGDLKRGLEVKVERPGRHPWRLRLPTGSELTWHATALSSVSASKAVCCPRSCSPGCRAGRDVGGLTSADYGLAHGESVREAANRVWAYLTGVWTSYRSALELLPEGDRATSLTRDRWLQIVLDQLGYGRVPDQSGGRCAGRRQSVPGLARVAVGARAPAWRADRPGPAYGGRGGCGRSGATVDGAGAAEPFRRPSVGDPVQRVHAAPAARLHLTGRSRHTSSSTLRRSSMASSSATFCSSTRCATPRGSQFAISRSGRHRAGWSSGATWPSSPARER